MKPIADVLDCVDKCGRAAERTREKHECHYGDEAIIDCVDRLEDDYLEIMAQVSKISTIDRLREICEREADNEH